MERVADGEPPVDEANARIDETAERPSADRSANSSSRRSSRLPKLTLAGCLIAMLGVGAFLGGRRAGYDSGYADGFEVDRAVGVEKGRELAGIDLLRYRRFAQRYEKYPVEALIAARLGVDPTAKTDDALIEAQLEKLAEEVRSEFALDADSVDPSMTTAEVESWGYARRRELHIHADGWRQIGIAKYLASKEDYLAWKRSQQKP